MKLEQLTGRIIPIILAAASFFWLAGTSFATAGTATITVQVDQPGHAVSPTLYGIFFEDINCSADGGIYAELVRNRSFEDSDKPEFWSALQSGSARVEMTVDTSQPISPKNPRSLKVTITNPAHSRTGVVNNGFWGMAITKGEVYELSLMARGGDGFTGPLAVSLESDDGVVYAQEAIPVLTDDWKPYKLSLTAKDTDPTARLVISTTQSGAFWLDMVSLFPGKTWKDRPNGLRPDLVEMLAALKPGFVRFPGGCWVEGESLATAYRWKQTVGDPSERRTQHNLWGYEATHGLGYHEYLQLCEDLGAAPLFVINCGMSHTEMRKQPANVDGVEEYVQDALDAIEYANGPVSSTWGALRAWNGHPAPFHLQYMEIGNENGGRAYHARYPLFADAIKAKYPEMHLIADEAFDPPGRPLEIVDEHYYSSPEFFINNAGRYDSYSRTGYKVYVGEYAVTQGSGQGNLRAAVAEAAFMTGLERNSDVVVMASYAPLFANVHFKKWNPDLIDFDSSRVYGIPSYFVQQMFSQNRGDVVLPMTVDAPKVGMQPKSGFIGVGTWLTQAEFKDIKVTRGNETLFTCDFSDGTQGWQLHGGAWAVQDGALRQMANAVNVRAFAGNKSWNNYTYSLKARKLGGAEGFLIPFLVQDEDVKSWWNIGGWGNTRHGLELEGVVAKDVPGSIETGRWYDIRIELNGDNIKCYLDGKLIHDANFTRTAPLYGVASRAGNDIVLKVVNVSPEDQDTTINLNGANISPTATTIVLAAEKPQDENTLDQPEKVAPVTSIWHDAGTSFHHTFAGNSVTIMRLKAL
jgi:alpha-L-arabinofuranosidase